MADVRIVRMFEETGFNVDGKSVNEMHVHFRVGDDGPFVKKYPMATWNPIEARADVDRFARELQQLRGQ